MQDFVIDKVSWHTSVKGNPETMSDIRERFWQVTAFLQQHRLVTHPLAAGIDEIGEEFEIRRSHVTENGFRLLQAAYDKWLRKLDKGMAPSDMRLFERELSKLKAHLH